MKLLMTSAATVAVAISMAGSAGAQTGGALGETSMRPMDITCQDLAGASEEERSGLIYFIAGYRAAMQAGTEMESDKMTGTDTSGAAGAAGGTDAAAGGTDTAAAGGTTGGTDAAAGGTTGGAAGGTDTAAAGGTTGGTDAAAGGTTGGAAGGTDTAAAGGTTGGTAGGAGGGMGGGDVMVSRAFFAMSPDEILTACEGNDTMNAGEAIGGAQGGAQ